MKAAKVQTFYITVGDVYMEQFTFLDNDDNPIDLTQFDEIIMDIRTGQDVDAKFIYTASLTNTDISVSGDNNNIITINISPLNTILWTDQTLFRDIRFIKTTGEVYTYVYGDIQVRKNITE